MDWCFHRLHAGDSVCFPLEVERTVKVHADNQLGSYQIQVFCMVVIWRVIPPLHRSGPYKVDRVFEENYHRTKLPFPNNNSKTFANSTLHSFPKVLTMWFLIKTIWLQTLKNLRPAFCRESSASSIVLHFFLALLLFFVPVAHLTLCY